MKQSQKLNRKYFNLISLLGNRLGFFFSTYKLRTACFEEFCIAFIPKRGR